MNPWLIHHHLIRTAMLVLPLVLWVLCGAQVQGQGQAVPQGKDPWWANAVFYNVLVDSFKDGDGDGLGDLRGLTKQISYVKALGADAVILSPLSARSSDCSAPGVVDLREMDQRYGNLEAFSAFLDKAKKLELSVVITLPLQSVSTSSEWFNSSAERVPGFEDRLVWRDDEPPPENDTTWTLHEPRTSYYATINSEALINICSDAAVAELAAAQCAWLRRGVAGVLLEPDFRDQGCGERLVKKLAAEAMSCARAAGLEIPVILVSSSLPPAQAAKYYADGSIGANIVLSNALASPNRSSAAETALAFYGSLLNAPDDGVPCWMTSSSNESRITTRYGSDMVDAINILALILPGAALIQQGDELGAADTILEWANSDKCWPRQAVASSAPFPWDDSSNGGFTAGEPWLPLAGNYRYANAKTEFGNDLSHVGVVRVAAAMRKSPAIGPHAEIKRLGGAVAILRWGASGSLLAVANVARDQTEIQLSQIPGLPPEMSVATSSAGSSFAVGSHVNVEKTLKMSPGEAFLLAGPPRHCGGPGPVDKITNKLTEGWQKLNKYFSNL